MTKEAMKCPCFQHTSNGTGKYYITCKDGSRSDRQTFKSTDARKIHVEKNCMRSETGCKLFQPTSLQAEPYEDIPPPADPQPEEDEYSNAALITRDFDYSVLDQETADFVMSATATIMRIRSATVMAIGRELAPVRERLSNRRNGTWQQWCRSIGMSDDSATRYIRAFEWIMANNVDVQVADSIPSGLLFEASRPSAPKELQEQVLSGDITTRGEYIQLSEKLKQSEQEAQQLAQESEANRRWAEANANDLTMERKRLADREKDVRQLQATIDTLQRQSRDNGETESLKRQLADLREKLSATTQELVHQRAMTPLEVSAVTTKEVLSEADAERIKALEAENNALKQKARDDGSSLESIKIIRNNISRSMSSILPIFLAEAGAHTTEDDPVWKAMKAMVDDVTLIRDELTRILLENM